MATVKIKLEMYYIVYLVLQMCNAGDPCDT